MIVQIIRPQDGLPRATGASLHALANAIWPPEPGKSVPTLDEALAAWKQQESVHFVIGDDDTVLAHALIFRREVSTLQGALMVGALATVCVHPGHRGQGWGADVVRAAFDYLPRLGAEVSLFQTGVPRFYEKLGARLVTNRFVNGKNPDDLNNPFWDTCEMIYPAAFDWPDGQIDLNGPGY
ncbi:MAG: GNAT family N-acetyltransferase [Cytophagales bacterium]|nr:GNAT family N-acetyltransferase [Armatimonadota bacterium]